MDAREGALRSQLTISPEGHCHMRSAHARSSALSQLCWHGTVSRQLRDFTCQPQPWTRLVAIFYPCQIDRKSFAAPCVIMMTFCLTCLPKIIMLMTEWKLRRSLQGEPYAAVFHRRIKMSSGGHRLKIEQKFQLLSPGVMPVQYHSIWHRWRSYSCSSPWPAHGLMHRCG